MAGVPVEVVLNYINENVPQDQVGAVGFDAIANKKGGSRVNGADLEEAAYTRLVFLVNASQEVGSPRSFTANELALATARSLDWVYKMLNRMQSHGFCGTQERGGARASRTKLSAVHDAALMDIVRHHPEQTLEQLRGELFLREMVSVSPSTIDRHLTNLGFTLNVRAVIARQRADPNVIQYMVQYRTLVANIDPHRIGFMDSAQVNRRGGQLRSRKARCAKGGRVTVPKLFERNPESTMMTAVLTTAGMVCIDMTDEHVDAEYMNDYWIDVAEALHAGGFTHFILDNAPVHNLARITMTFGFYGITVLFLPPYVTAQSFFTSPPYEYSSPPPPPPPPPCALAVPRARRYTPELNPIEMAWQWVKAELYKHLARFEANPSVVLTELLNAIPAQFCENWIRLAGCYNI